MDNEQHSLAVESTGSGKNTAGWYLTGQLTDFESAQDIDVDCSPFKIGRRQGLSLTLPRPAVSYIHAEIVIDHNGLLISDLNSTNGTYRNGHRITQPTRLQEGDLLQVADVPMRVKRRPVAAAVEPEADPFSLSDSQLSLSDFDRFLRMRTVVPHFQPMVSLKDGTIVGCEVLARSRIAGLQTPQEMFTAASRLHLEAELSRNLRLIGFEKGTMLWQVPCLFLNTHAEELATFGLLDSLRRIREVNSDLPITIEIKEPVAQDTDLIQRFREKLISLKMGLAYDQFGSGQTRRAQLAAVRPNYVKFDMHLIREIHLAPAAQQALLANLVHMVKDLGIVAVAVGVESEFEHEVCREVGFDLGQGFFYGKPAENVSRTASLDLVSAAVKKLRQPSH